MCGIGGNIDKCSVEQMELWVIYDSLMMTWDTIWSDIIVETDGAFTIKVIHDGLRGQSHRDLILRIRKLCSREWRVGFEQILERQTMSLTCWLE